MTEVRRARVEDLERMLEIAFEDYMEAKSIRLGLGFSALSAVQTGRFLIENPEHGVLLVAEDEGRVVGLYIGFFNSHYVDRSQRILYERGHHVIPSHRGKGIGKALSLEAERIALEHGVTMHAIGVTTWNENSKERIERLQKNGVLFFQMDGLKTIVKKEGA